MSEPAAKQMNAPDFLAWAQAQPKGNFELPRGEIAATAPEQAERGWVKFNIARALASSIERASLTCEAFVDSLGVAIDEFTVYQPDALVNCGEAVAPDAPLAPSPSVIVEVISPSSRRLDANAKLADYFCVASVRHYLVVDCNRRLVLHYHRQGEQIGMALPREGAIALDPPGLSIELADIFP